MGPFLISHRAVASTRTKVKSASRRWDEVPNATGKPHGGRESGSRSASGEAGVCVQAHGALSTLPITFEFELRRQTQTQIMIFFPQPLKCVCALVCVFCSVCQVVPRFLVSFGGGVSAHAV